MRCECLTLHVHFLKRYRSKGKEVSAYFSYKYELGRSDVCVVQPPPADLPSQRTVGCRLPSCHPPPPKLTPSERYVRSSLLQSLRDIEVESRCVEQLPNLRSFRQRTARAGCSSPSTREKKWRRRALFTRKEESARELFFSRRRSEPRC